MTYWGLVVYETVAYKTNKCASIISHVRLAVRDMSEFCQVI